MVFHYLFPCTDPELLLSRVCGFSQVDLRASNRVITHSPYLYINMVPARQRAHKAVAGLKKSVLTDDAWRRLYFVAEEPLLLLVPGPVYSINC